MNYDVEVIEDRNLFSNTATVIFDSRDDDELRTKWLETRNKSIGGSEIGAIAGLSEYGSSLTVYNDKLGLVEKFKGNIHTVFGTRLEPFIRYYVQEDFKKETGIELTTYEYPYMMIDNEYNFLSANIDGLAKLSEDYVYWENRDTAEIKYIPKGEYIGLEIKTASEFLKNKWEGDEIPDSYLAQIYHYMGVTGLNYFLIIYLLGKEVKWKVVPRNEDDIKALREIGVDFWENHIIPKIPPEPTGIKKETDEILEQQVLDDAEEIDITDKKLTKYNEISEQIKELEKEREKIKQEIFLEMGNSKKATDGSYKLSRYIVTRDKIDNKTLKDKYPLTYAAVLNGTTEYVNMRVTKCK